VWLAFMEGQGLWHGLTVTKEMARKSPSFAADWPKPFAAKWRITGASGFAAYLSLDAGSAVKRDLYPWLLEVRGDTLSGLIESHDPDLASDLPATAITCYPIDRTAATPLDAFTPMDVVRNTLGVGPCQYVLDAEGLESDEEARPEAVAAWIDKRLKKPNAAATAEDVKARLDSMAAYISRAQERLQKYWDAADSLCETLQLQPVLSPPDGTPMKRPGFHPLLDMQFCFNVSHDPKRYTLKQEVATLTDRLVAALRKGEVPAMWPQMADRLREIGAFLDSRLSEFRMVYRDAKQAAREVEWQPGVTSEQKEMARKARFLCEEILAPEKPPAKP
jgi:hypothetical protein